MTKPRLTLDDPAGFVAWLGEVRKRGSVSLDDVDVAQVFAIAAVAALARHDSREFLLLENSGTTGASRFAHAVGIEEIVAGGVEREPLERDRTVSLTRVKGRAAVVSVAPKIVDLLLPRSTSSDAADLFHFVLVELLRNVVQHSQDSAGGIVVAQHNDAGPYAGAPALQVAVVDNGIGIFEALRRKHPAIRSPAEALMRAFEPHVSGTFAEGGSGTVENAGLGLFFVSEMAKMTRGRLFVASRGATYFLDRSGSPNSQPVITNGAAPDYPGTLVAFETALGQVRSYERVVRDIHELARERTPKRLTHHWLRFEEPPQDATPIVVNVAAEDTVAAQAFSAKVLEPRLMRRESIGLDFRNLRVCTQSFLHALLHESVRLAWALKVPVYILHATPAVRAQLEFVEAYSLGG